MKSIELSSLPLLDKHESVRGFQYLSIRYTDRLAEAEIEPSVGSRGDSYNNALAESVIGLYKTEVIRRKGPWRSFDDVEYATLEWVDRYNNQRLFGPIGLIPPAEHEANYYREDPPPEGRQRHAADPPRAPVEMKPSLGKPLRRTMAFQRSVPSRFAICATGWCLWLAGSFPPPVHLNARHRCGRYRRVAEKWHQETDWAPLETS